MEFPDLGKHCSDTNCRQLDFLPVKCDACGKIFCHNHFRYDKHNCPESYRKDNQVPVCPLCNAPISMKKGEAPDVVVGQHIDNDCKLKKKTSNKCNMKGCKQKELVPVVCDKCRKNYCIRHRLAEDHECQGFEGSGRGVSNAAAAAVSRAGNSSKSNGPFKNVGKPQQTAMSNVGRDLDRERRDRQGTRSQGQTRSQGGQRPQGSAMQTFQSGMSEDEAMARAMAISMADTPGSQPTGSANKKQQEEQDEALARALQQEEEQRRNGGAASSNRPATNRQSSKDKSSCQVS